MESMQTWLTEAYEADKIAIEDAYEALMQFEDAQHRDRMTQYAQMRTEALQRLSLRYGVNTE